MQRQHIEPILRTLLPNALCDASSSFLTSYKDSTLSTVDAAQREREN